MKKTTFQSYVCTNLQNIVRQRVYQTVTQFTKMNWIASYDINEIQMHVYRNLICRVQSFSFTWIFI